MKKQKTRGRSRAIFSAFRLLPSTLLIAAVRVYHWTLSPALAFMFGPGLQ